MHPTDKSQIVKECGNFTSSIITNTSKFITRKSFKDIEKLEDLYGRTIATPIGWEQTEIFKTKYKDKFKVIETADTNSAMKKVISGEADFAIDYENVFKYYILKDGITSLKIQGQWFDDENYNSLYMASHKDNQILHSILQKAINSLKSDELQDIQEKWFGKDENKEIKIELNEKEIDFIKNNPVVKFGYSTHSAPAIMEDLDKNSIGLIQDLGKIITEKTGLKLEFKKGIWNDILKEAKNKEINGLAVTVSKSNDRKKYFDFTKPYMTQTPIVLTKLGNANLYKLPKDLIGKKMGVIKGIDSMYDAALKLKAKAVYFDNINELIKATVGNDIDFFIFFENIFYLAEDIGLNYIELAFPLDIRKDAFFSVNKSYPELTSIINKVFNTISKNEFIAMKNHWFKTTFEKNSLDLNKDEMSYLKNNEIKMCIDPDWEPYEKIDENGNHIGLAADLLKLVQKKINKNFTLIKTKSWDDSIQKKKEGKCDILSFLNKTPKRSEFLNFTDVLYDEPEVIIAKDEVAFVNGFEGLKNKTIGIIKGYQLEELIKKEYPDIKYIYVKNKEDAIKKVDNGKIFASVNALMGGAYLIRKNNLLNIKIAGETKRTNQYRIGVDKNEPILLSILDKAVKSITKQEKEQIVSRWIAVKFEKQIDYSLLWQIGLVVFIVILLISYMNYRLNFKVEQQIKELRAKDNLLLSQSKNAAMGELVANIAHQWRQPLASLNGLILNLDFDVNSGNVEKKRIMKYLNKMEEITLHMSKTIEDFMNYFKPDKEKTKFKIKDLFEETSSILNYSINKDNIKLEFVCDENLTITSFYAELFQVLLTLINNSKDAIKSNDIKDGIIFIKAIKSGKSVIISLEDNGGGIPENIIDKIFEPYFTTKQKSDGTGLGLHIVNTLVTSSLDGQVKVENIENGAKFSINLKN